MLSSKIVFLHPDLGVGGAERLVVDAAISLKQSGHKVSFITAHHSEDHCFEETKDGTFPVIVVGDWLPRNIFGRFFALCAYIRMLYCSLYLITFHKPDIVFCDLISVCIPLIHLSKAKVIFYCHFPDQLLSKKGSFLKSLYRAPLNWLEEKTTGCADHLFVNSKFTRSVFQSTFKSIKKTPDILYPSINIATFDKVTELSLDFLLPHLPHNPYVFLSINRYERKKYVELAINALRNLKYVISKDKWDRTRLIIAGGYDNRVNENREYYLELTTLANKLEISDKIYFLKSPSDSHKISLIKSCTSVIYTPPNEHFGIVPIEAMYCEKPVIALNSGGPTETIVNNETGFLCEMTQEDFANAMAKLVKTEGLSEKMGKAGSKRFQEKFSFQAFSKNLNKSVSELVGVIRS